MAEIADLKPCPFCGKKPVERRIVELYPADADGPAGEFDAHHTIGCDDCGIEMGEEYRDEAAKHWNRRVRAAPRRIERPPLQLEDEVPSLPSSISNG